MKIPTKSCHLSVGSTKELTENTPPELSECYSVPIFFSHPITTINCGTTVNLSHTRRLLPSSMGV